MLYDSLVTHSRIARALGPYKLSLHSGSDKFSIYGLVAEATGRMVHLKTSGTTYLCALGVLADRAPALFREIYAVSRELYRGTRASYQVSARLDQTPPAAEVPDAELGRLVERRLRWSFRRRTAAGRPWIERTPSAKHGYHGWSGQIDRRQVLPQIGRTATRTGVTI